jgi:hypothetical protein
MADELLVAASTERDTWRLLKSVLPATPAMLIQRRTNPVKPVGTHKSQYDWPSQPLSHFKDSHNVLYLLHTS